MGLRTFPEVPGGGRPAACGRRAAAALGPLPNIYIRRRLRALAGMCSDTRYTKILYLAALQVAIYLIKQICPIFKSFFLIIPMCPHSSLSRLSLTPSSMQPRQPIESFSHLAPWLDLGWIEGDALIPCDPRARTPLRRACGVHPRPERLWACYMGVKKYYLL